MKALVIHNHCKTSTKLMTNPTQIKSEKDQGTTKKIHNAQNV